MKAIMSPFHPRGSRALRVIVADRAASAALGELLTFSELCDLIGVNDNSTGHAHARQAVSAARPVLLSQHGRALVAVRGEGYRVALPGELAGVALDYRDRSDRSMTRALAVVNKADTTTMNSEELRRFQAVGTIVKNLHRRMNSAEDRLSAVEEAVFGKSRPTIPGEVVKELHSTSQLSTAKQSEAERSRAKRSTVKRGH